MALVDGRVKQDFGAGGSSAQAPMSSALPNRAALAKAIVWCVRCLI
jgi:hypothetical protein